MGYGVDEMYRPAQGNHESSYASFTTYIIVYGRSYKEAEETG